MKEIKEIEEKEESDIFTPEEIDENFRKNIPFPRTGRIDPLLAKYGFTEDDILEIRKILTDEIKRQNEDELNKL